MLSRTSVCAAILSMLVTATCHSEEKRPLPALAICYNPAIPAGRLEPFDLVVLDSSYPSSQLKILKKQGKKTFAYLSLGAVDRVRSWYDPLDRAGALGDRNPGFTSRQIDITKEVWPELLTRAVVPELLEKGFDGIFLDDLDLIYRNKQQRRAAKIIAHLRGKFPTVPFMANRGLEYLPSFARDVNYVLLESCAALPGKIRPPGDLEWALGHLQAGKKVNPKLRGCAIDYYATKPGPMTPELRELIQAIGKIHQEHGLIGCISTQDLQTVPIAPTK